MDVKDIAVLLCMTAIGLNGFLMVFRNTEIVDVMFGPEPSEKKRLFGSIFWFGLTAALLWASWENWFG